MLEIVNGGDFIASVLYPTASSAQLSAISCACAVCAPVFVNT